MMAGVEQARLIYLPRERRIPNIRGTPGDELSPEEWTSEVRRVVSARSMGGLEGADYAISHLDGNARREVLNLPPDDVATAEIVCTVVCREFGDQRPSERQFTAGTSRHWSQCAISGTPYRRATAWSTATTSPSDSRQRRCNDVSG